MAQLTIFFLLLAILPRESFGEGEAPPLPPGFELNCGYADGECRVERGRYVDCHDGACTFMKDADPLPIEKTQTASPDLKGTAAGVPEQFTKKLPVQEVTPTLQNQSGASEAAATSQVATTKEMNSVSEKKIATQESSATDAKTVYLLGANHSATVGVVFCAEGANETLESPQVASPGFAKCEESFRTAKAMNAIAKKHVGFEEDPNVTATEGAKTTFEKFERNFGVSGEEFMKKMFKSGASRTSLAEVLSAKISPEKLEAAFASADAEDKKPALEKFTLDPPKLASRKPSSASLRDRLKAQMDAEQENEEPLREEVDAEAKMKGSFENLEALKDIEPGNSLHKEEELSIFDVVHRKYESLANSLFFHKKK